MKTLYPSLVFPDTDIFTYRQFPLLLFGTPVYFLEPNEPGPEQGESDRDIFIKSGLCQAHTPAPLKEDRERFTRLIDDIRNRKDDYAAQLSALTVAAMSSNNDESNSEKRYQIISSMLGEKTPSASNNNAQQLELWQSRLVLAISEILKKEEEELHQELQLLDAQEMAMFRSLQGDTGPEATDPFSELERIKAQLENARPREMKMRFRSWLRLMKTAPIPTVSLYLASSADALDQLINEYDKNGRETAFPILELNLPERIEAGPTHVVSQIRRFHEQSLNVRQKICTDLDSLLSADLPSSDSADTLLPSGPDYLSRWNDLIENHFPAGSHGASSLLFYLLPNCRIAGLLGLEAGVSSPQAFHGLCGVFKK